jgi:hypothetical protein
MAKDSFGDIKNKKKEITKFRPWGEGSEIYTKG